MKSALQPALLRCALAAGFWAFAGAAVNAQVPAAVAVPVIETAVPIVVGTLKPHKGPQSPKFEGAVGNATVAQINRLAAGGCDTVRVAVPDKRDTDALAEIIRQHEDTAFVHTGIVMPDHVHIVIQPLWDRNGVAFALSELLRLMKGRSARTIKG